VSVVPYLLGACVLAVIGLHARYGSFRTLLSKTVLADGGHTHGHESDEREKKSNLLRWVTTVDHKDIGVLYICFGTVAALWGGVDAMMIRTELLTPAIDVWSEETYNALFTTHGLTMLFLFVTPVFFGIANYVLPLFIGADDLAFPRVNAIGFWLLPPSLLLIRGGLITELVGKTLGVVLPRSMLEVFFVLAPPATGWTLYTPLSTQLVNPQIDFMLLGLHLSGLSTTMAAINFVVTIFLERGDDVELGNLDIFSWSMLTTSGIILFAFPLLGSAILMLLLDRNFGTTFFAVEGGGPLLWQNLFWFFGHPEVYIIFLPATGLMSTILPKFSGRKLFGFEFIVYSTLAIGVLSFGVWAHHMFTTGMDPRILASFMIVSVAIAVPSAIKVFNWLTTMWKGNIRLTAPMLFCAGGLGLFVIGGITGVFLASIPIDVLYQDTYYVVGHFHMILMAIIPFQMFAASYYWFPLITERMYDQRLARIQAVLTIVGVFVTFGSFIVLGALGMPRRYAAYPPQFQSLHVIASIGAFVIGFAVLLWVYNMLRSVWYGDPVRDADVWDLKRTYQFTREWQAFEERLAEKYGVESPPPEQREMQPSSESHLPDDEADDGRPVAFEDLSGVGRDVVVGAVSGLVGVVLMTAVLYVGDVFGVFRLTAFAELAELVGITGSPLVGYLLFVGGGMTTWALLFVTFADFLPGEPLVRTGLVFAVVMLPGFFVAFYRGQSGVALVGYVLVSFVAHLAYGAGLGLTFKTLGGRLETSLVHERDADA
jgi:cytochrome c oxidase subunit 1